MTSPLKPNPVNPRYFADPHGNAVLLTGFHTWSNLVDIWRGEPKKPFGFDWYLEELSRLGHNFIRLWAWDALCSWNPDDRVAPYPWARTGPGEAVDGKPKINFDVFDEEYFERLRTRVSAANERGIYVGVMLFESWATQQGNTTPLDWHITAKQNNVNGIDGLANLHDGWMMGWMGLGDPAIQAIQERYIERVVRELNGFSNVLYEVSNEAGKHSYAWQQHVVDYVRHIESSLPNRHLVAITGGMGTRDAAFFTLDADYLAPEGWTPQGEINSHRDGLATWGEAPETDKTPIVLDTDHIWGIGGNVRWAWQSFLRGYHCLYMDRIDDQPFSVFVHPWWSEPTNLALRAELGRVLRLAKTLNLNTMVPQNDGADSSYCLAGPEVRVVLSLDGRPLKVMVPFTFSSATWHEVGSDQSAAAKPGSDGTWTNPFPGDAVLVIRSA
jgi:hypothetical protein